MKKTPNNNIEIKTSDRRRAIGIDINPGQYPVAQVIYARTVDIDGYIIETVETEHIDVEDLNDLKGGDPGVVQALFRLAIAAAAVPLAEVWRIINLRKSA